MELQREYNKTASYLVLRNTWKGQIVESNFCVIFLTRKNNTRHHVIFENEETKFASYLVAQTLEMANGYC